MLYPGTVGLVGRQSYRALEDTTKKVILDGDDKPPIIPPELIAGTVARATTSSRCTTARDPVPLVPGPQHREAAVAEPRLVLRRRGTETTEKVWLTLLGRLRHPAGPRIAWGDDEPERPRLGLAIASTPTRPGRGSASSPSRRPRRTRTSRRTTSRGCGDAEGVAEAVRRRVFDTAAGHDLGRVGPQRPRRPRRSSSRTTGTASSRSTTAAATRPPYLQRPSTSTATSSSTTATTSPASCRSTQFRDQGFAATRRLRPRSSPTRPSSSAASTGAASPSEYRERGIGSSPRRTTSTPACSACRSG
jgi:hypothetical protein